MSAGPFVAGLKCSGNVFWGFSSFACQRGTLKLIAIHLITLHNILEYMQITIIQTEAADFVKMYICAILKTFGHDCIHGQRSTGQLSFQGNVLPEYSRPMIRLSIITLPRNRP
jgi:hypothetical protein